MNETKALEKVAVHASGRRKTICTSAVLAHFGIAPDSYRYCDCRKDVERILRANGFSVRSRRSRVGYGLTVGQLRERLRALNEPGLYYVSVPGHALLLSDCGETVVDTDPRDRDRRSVLAITKVTRS